MPPPRCCGARDGLEGHRGCRITVLVMFGGGVFMSGAQASGCGGGEVVATIAISSRPIAGYSGDQLANAAAIMNARDRTGARRPGSGHRRHDRDGRIRLRVLDHGDQAGPRPRGLFQQRDTWGSLADIGWTRPSRRCCSSSDSSKCPAGRP